MLQTLLLLYFILGTVTYLLRRELARRIGHQNRLVNSVFYLFILPVGLILFATFPHNLNVGILNFVLLLGGSLIWPLYNIIAFRANKKVDVGIFAVINNLSPLFTLAVALPFLGEHLTGKTFTGIALLILSGVLATSSQFKKESKVDMDGILTCLSSAAVLGIAIAYERFMLTRVDFGTYMLLGWGSQIVWMLILTGRELKGIRAIFRKESGAAGVLFTWSALSAVRSACFILGLKISAASLMSAANDFVSVAVVVAAYFYLHEREHMTAKSIAVATGVAGLLLVTTH